ncbi:MAG TPA: hypothetical protein VME92_09325 [Acetobacteraceae bacterium]|nr:hypothetical protein [Acetobacteraceae bacterium]
MIHAIDLPPAMSGSARGWFAMFPGMDVRRRAGGPALPGWQPPQRALIAAMEHAGCLSA